MRLTPNLRPPLALLVGAAPAGAATALAFSAQAISDALSADLGRSLAFLAAALVLQLAGLKAPGHGSLGVSAVGILGAVIALGTGPAMAVAVCCALVQCVRARGLVHRALFDAANLALAAGVAGLVFEAVARDDSSGLVLLAALLAGLAYVVANIGLLCAAMALAEARSPLAIWRERFHFARFHFLAFGALALLAASAYEQLGAAALLPFVLPPLLLALSMRESLARLRRGEARAA